MCLSWHFLFWIVLTVVFVSLRDYFCLIVFSLSDKIFFQKFKFIRKKKNFLFSIVVNWVQRKNKFQKFKLSYRIGCRFELMDTPIVKTPAHSFLCFFFVLLCFFFSFSYLFFFCSIFSSKLNCKSSSETPTTSQCVFQRTNKSAKVSQLQSFQSISVLNWATSNLMSTVRNENQKERKIKRKEKEWIVKNFSNKFCLGTCGCFGVQASALGITVGPFDMGCFNMGVISCNNENRKQLK